MRRRRCSRGLSGRLMVARCSRESAVDVEPLVVVDVQQPADRTQQRVLRGPGRRVGSPPRGAARSSCGCRRRRPRARGRCSRGSRRARRRRASAARRSVRATCSGSRRGCCEARSPARPGRARSAAGRQEREVVAHLPLDVCARAAEQRASAGRSGTPCGACRRNRAPCIRSSWRLRSPRPSCWRKSVGLSVGRSRSSVSTAGTSTPSLKRSTVNTTLHFPVARDRASAAARSPASSPPRAQRPAGRAAEALAMKSRVPDADAVAERRASSRGRRLAPDLLDDQTAHAWSAVRRSSSAAMS